MYKVELDVCYESANEAKSEAEQCGVKFAIVQEYGPGGGNPLVEFSSENLTNLVKYLEEMYCKNDKADLLFLVSHIQ